MKGSTKSWELNSSKKCIQRLKSSTTSLGVLGEVVVLLCLLNDYKKCFKLNVCVVMVVLSVVGSEWRQSAVRAGRPDPRPGGRHGLRHKDHEYVF